MTSTLEEEFQLKPCSVVLERRFPFPRPVTKDKNNSTDMKPCSVILQRSFPFSNPVTKNKNNSGDTKHSEIEKLVATSSSSSESDSSSSENERSYKNKFHRLFPPQKEKKLESSSKKKILPCSLCENTFNTNESLHSHMKTHLTFPFKCVICKETFKFRTAFVYHMKRNHPESKLYVCEYHPCNRSYCKKKELKDHQKKHFKYVCKYCKKRFVRKYRMWKHVTNRH